MRSTSIPANVAPRYIVISPVRDEALYIEQTIHSMLNQTVLPAQWIIVNDGSTDGTGEIVERCAREHPWITAIHRQNRGCRKAGGGVIEAFYDGYKAIRTADWQFLVKLDGDLSFEANYFEQCFAKFDTNSLLGIGGGVICHERSGELQVEPNPMFHVRGANKIYRRECWNDIVSLIQSPGWDTIDEIKANMLGWSTQSFQDLKVLHHRFTGAANGAWGNAVKNGSGSYICGYHPLFMLLKAAKHVVQKPYLVGSIGMLYGFVRGYLQHVPQIDDRNVIAYLRQQQLRKLLFGSTIWK